MSTALKTPTLLAPAARESKRGQQAIETQRSRALRVFHAALADRDSNPCNIVVMGDSMTEGQGATAWGARWVDRFRDQMRRQFPVSGVTGGVGFISTTNGLTGGSSSIFPVAHSGTVTTNSQSGPKKRSRAFSASGHITTWTVTGTAVDLLYWQGTGTGTVKWSVDGGATTNQVTSGASSASGTALRISLGTSGSHTVTVEWVSGTSYIEGLIVYDGDENAGIRVHEAGRSGISAYQWDQVNHETATTSWARAIGQLNPHLLIIGLGINDWAQSTANGGSAGTAADYKTYLKSLVADVRSNTTIDPSIMLLSYAAPNASPFSTVYSFAQYADVCEQIAAEDPEVCTLDLGLRLPVVLGDTLSLYSDTTHPTNKGHALIADHVSRSLGGGDAGGGTSSAASESAGNGIYGDGSDGVGSISGSTTLTRDMFYSSLTVTSTGTLITSGYRVYVAGTCQVDASGVIHNDGAAGTTGGSLGAGAAGGTMAGGTNGGAGGAAAGSNGTNSVANSLGAAVGGAGGSGSGGAGGTAGTNPAASAGSGTLRSVPFSAAGYTNGASGNLFARGGSGGGGGGGDGSQGGGGGGGGGALLIAAKTLVNNGTIRAAGGAGGNAAGTNRGGGGGGGGGLVVLTYNSKSGSGTITAPGGTGGSKTGTGIAGSAGSTGTVIEVVNA